LLELVLSATVLLSSTSKSLTLIAPATDAELPEIVLFSIVAFEITAKPPS